MYSSFIQTPHQQTAQCSMNDGPIHVGSSLKLPTYSYKAAVSCYLYSYKAAVSCYLYCNFGFSTSSVSCCSQTRISSSSR